MESNGQVVKAMALIRRRRDGALLVSEGGGPSGTLFHRPLGGHVEFGEYALDTVHREFREEIGQALTTVRPAGVLENIFEWDGETQHEVVFVFSAAFADPSAYEIPEQLIRDARSRTRVIWRPPAAASPPLYPSGVSGLAQGKAGRLSRRPATGPLAGGSTRPAMTRQEELPNGFPEADCPGSALLCGP